METTSPIPVVQFPEPPQAARYCVNCKYYRDTSAVFGHPECASPNNISTAHDPVTGKLFPLARLCESQRASLYGREDRCGPMGNWYQAKETAE